MDVSSTIIDFDVRHAIMKIILSSPMLVDDVDLFVCVQNAVGEALCNLLKRESSARVVWEEKAEGLIVEIHSDDYLGENCDKLSLLLGHAQKCVDSKIQCNFWEEQHGLGHYYIAALSSESCYSEGILTMRFLTDKRPKLDFSLCL